MDSTDNSGTSSLSDYFSKDNLSSLGDLIKSGTGIYNSVTGNNGSGSVAQKVTSALGTPAAPANSNKLYWIVGGGVALLVVLFVFLRRK